MTEASSSIPPPSSDKETATTPSIRKGDVDDTCDNECININNETTAVAVNLNSDHGSDGNNTKNAAVTVTAASRPGGKFAAVNQLNSNASMNSNSGIIQGNIRPRGKFASVSTSTSTDTAENDGTTKTTQKQLESDLSATQSSIMSSTTMAIATSSNDITSIAAEYAALAKMAKQQKNKTSSVAKVFDNLDKAEALVLDLLSISASTAQILSDMCTSNISTSSTTDQSNSNSRAPSTVAVPDMDQSAVQVRKYSQQYLQKVKQIHTLLEPYSHLIKPYGNINLPKNNASTHKTYNSDDDSNSNTASNSIDINLENNMYSSRLKLRLAVERKNIMKEYLLLESCVSPAVTTENETKTSANINKSIDECIHNHGDQQSALNTINSNNNNNNSYKRKREEE